MPADLEKKLVSQMTKTIYDQRFDYWMFGNHAAEQGPDFHHKMMLMAVFTAKAILTQEGYGLLDGKEYTYLHLVRGLNELYNDLVEDGKI